MTIRVTRFVVGAALTLAVPGAAQRAGSIEAGAFARYTRFDNSLGVGSAIGGGGRLAVFLQPDLALEVDLARTSSDRPGGATLARSPSRSSPAAGGPARHPGRRPPPTTRSRSATGPSPGKPARAPSRRSCPPKPTRA